MIDSTHIWLSPEESISIPPNVWQKWSDRFIEVVIGGDAISCSGKGKARITDIGSDSHHMTWWGIVAIMGQVAPNQEICSYQDSTSVINERDITDRVFRALCSDTNIRTILDSFCAVRLSNIRSTSLQHSEKVQDTLRRHYDDTVGLAVQFVVNQQTPHQLYYIAGGELRFVQDVRKFFSHDNDTIIGAITE